MAAATGWYVYGVAEASAPVATRLVAEGRLAALVAAVPLSEFGEEALAERLNDRAWLEAHARSHQDVLQTASATAPVVPFRFGTIFRELDDVRAMLRTRQAELEDALERVRGRVEVGVKAWAAGGNAADPEPAATPAAGGRAYLEQRLGARDRARQASAALADIAFDAHERLLAHAVDGVANRPQPRELTGRDEAMILNGAYLVEDVAAILAELDRLAAVHRGHGVSFELTGPWPPYNFVDGGGDS